MPDSGDIVHVSTGQWQDAGQTEQDQRHKDMPKDFSQ